MSVKNILLLPALIICLLVTAAASDRAAEDGTGEARDFIEHGVAAPVARSRGAAAAVDGDGNRVVLVWPSARGTDSLMIIDAVTGEIEQIFLERGLGNSPFSVLFSSKNKFYTLFGERFYEFDPSSRSFTFVGEALGHASGMIEDGNGVIWAGITPGGHLMSFDPESRELANHGRINDDEWAQWLSTMAYDEAGWIYAGIGFGATQVAGYNPATGESRRFIPGEKRVTGRGRVFTGTDGKVYATAPGWGWHILEDGEASPLEAESPPVGPMPMKTGAQESVFRDFPDGSRILELDVPEGYMRVQDADGAVREVSFSYLSEGPGISSIIKGPDGALYGSTGHPLRLYRFDPGTGEFSHHGLKDYNGHMNAMASQRGIVFGAMYPYGDLYGYDITKPWRDRDADDPNPRRYGVRPSPDIFRTHVLLAHPDGRHLVMGGTPVYGATGGGLFIYDMETDASHVLSHEELLEHHSPYSLAALPGGDLVGGTSIEAGTGGRPKAEHAELYIFDFSSREVVWRAALFPGSSAVSDLLTSPEGLVYGITNDSIFFVFDPELRKLLHQESLFGYYGPHSGSQAPRVLALGADGNLYILFRESIVRVLSETFEHAMITETPVYTGTGTPLVDGRMYFTHGSHVWSFGAPGL